MRKQRWLGIGDGGAGNRGGGRRGCRRSSGDGEKRDLEDAELGLPLLDALRCLLFCSALTRSIQPGPFLLHTEPAVFFI